MIDLKKIKQLMSKANDNAKHWIFLNENEMVLTWRMGLFKIYHVCIEYDWIDPDMSLMDRIEVQCHDAGRAMERLR